MAQKESKSACFKLAAKHGHDLTDICEERTDPFCMPASVTPDEFVRGIDLILDAQEQFLSAVAPLSESVDSKRFGAAK